MANEISKIKLPGSTTEYIVKDNSAITDITRSGTTFTATKRDGTTFTFTQQDNNTTYTLGTNGNTVTLTPSSGSAQSITVPYATTSGTANTAKAVLTAGGDVIMGTTGSDSDDSGDIVWRYGNGNEKARLYTANEYTAKSGLNYRVYKKDGTSLYNGTIPLTDGTGASGTWGISISGNAATATKATQDGSGNTITSTYVKKSGDTMTGGLTISTANQFSQLTLRNEGSTANNYPTKLSFENHDTTTGYTSYGYIKCYKGNTYTTNMVIDPGCDMFIGSGDVADEHYALYAHDTSENFYATAANRMYLQADATTIANRRGMMITNSHEIVPCKADVPTDGIGCIGSTNYKWGYIFANHFVGNASTATSAETATKAAQDSDGNTINSTYLKRSGGTLTGRLTASKTICNVVTGSGTAAQDKGSGVSPRYFPAKWTYNTGLTAIDGDRLVVKIPVAGHDYGVYLSIDNGTKYYPVVANGTGRITTHYPNGTYIMVVFESDGSAASMFPLNGGDSRTTVTGGVWRVINYYDANSAVTQTATTGNANYEVLFSNTADNTTRTEGTRKSNAFIFNPTTGLKLGVSSQSAFPTLGIDVHDVRSVNFTPGALDRGANFFFSNNTMPNSNWWAGLHVKGWTGAYAAWEIVGSAHNNDSRTTPLYVRTSNLASTWGSWRKIYDTSNPPTKSEVGLGNVDNTADANKSVASATIATKARQLGDATIRPTTANTTTYDGALKYFLSSSSMSTAKPMADGGILSMEWDNNGGYTKQLYLGHGGGTSTRMQVRSQAAGTWGSWIPVGVFSQTTPTSGQVVITDGTDGGIKASGYTIAKSVPSNAVFTDTNNAVTQTATTTSANYELLFSATADNTTRTEGARKTDSLKYNPSTKELTLNGTMILNGYSRSTSTDPCPSIILKANNIDTDTAVTARTYGNSEINVHDKDGDRLGFVNWFKDADGSIGFAMSAQNKSTGGGNYYNTLEMRVDKTGNRAYSISDAKAFRTAINTTTCSFTKSISSLAGATIVRRGNVVTLEFGHQITSAGSYTNIGTVSPAPIETLHFVVNCGSSWQLARINTAGVVSFNNATSVAANAYLIGSCTYITAD